MTLPSNEVIFDRDGTTIIRTDPDSTNPVNITGTAEDLRNLEVQQAETWNDPQGAIVYLFFPEPYDLTGVAPMQPVGSANPKCHFSTDSTSPGTGDWFDWSTGDATTSAATAADGTNIPLPTLGQVANDTSNISQFHASATGVTAVRFRISSGSGSTRRILHLRIFGTPSSATSYLALWDDTTNTPAAVNLFDLGQIEVGTSVTRTFRVKNLHPTAQVDNVTLSTPNGVFEYEPHLHIDFDIGGGFAAPLNIGSLASEAISSVITMRRTVPEAVEFGDTGLASLLITGALS